ADIDGVRQVIAQTQDNIVGVSGTDGRLLWRRPFTTEFTQNIITPIVIGNTVLIAGYQKPTAAFRVVKSGEQWRTEDAGQNEGTVPFMADGALGRRRLFGR